MSINPALAAAMGGKAANGIFVDMSIDGPEIGTLTVYVDRAKNLPSRRTMGKQDPYCAVRFGKEVRKTDTDRRGGQTPRWEQEFQYTVHDSPDYYKLKMSVFNDDKKTELIGEAWLDLISVIVPSGGQTEIWQPLKCKEKYAGEVRIIAKYTDTRVKEVSPVSVPPPLQSGSMRMGENTGRPSANFRSLRQRQYNDGFQPDSGSPRYGSVSPTKQYKAYSPERISHATTPSYGHGQDRYSENALPGDDLYQTGNHSPYDQHGQHEHDEQNYEHEIYNDNRNQPYNRSSGYVAEDGSGYYEDEHYQQPDTGRRHGERPLPGREQAYRGERSSGYGTPTHAQTDDRRLPRRSETAPYPANHHQNGYSRNSGYDEYQDYPALPPSEGGRYYEGGVAPPPPSHRGRYQDHYGAGSASSPIRARSQARHASPGLDYHNSGNGTPSSRSHSRRHTLYDQSEYHDPRGSPLNNNNDITSALPQLPPSTSSGRPYRNNYGSTDAIAAQNYNTVGPNSGSTNFKRLPPRKSIGPLSGGGLPYSPDSFDAINPNTSRQGSAQPSPVPMRNSAPNSASVEQTPETPLIIDLNGKPIDPSDYLPKDTWAPDPVSMNPPKPVEPSRERPGGARDPRFRTWTGGANSPAQDPGYYNSMGRAGRHGRNLSQAPDYHSSGTPSGSVGRASGTGHGTVSSRSRGGYQTDSRNDGSGYGYQSRGDDLNALSAEMQMIDIGGSSRWRGRPSESTYY